MAGLCEKCDAPSTGRASMRPPHAAPRAVLYQSSEYADILESIATDSLDKARADGPHTVKPDAIKDMRIVHTVVGGVPTYDA
jgi:hypothetical protein